MEDDGIIAQFEQSDNITIPKYVGTTSPKYMKNVK